MKKILVALSFFTRIPINIKSEVTEEEFYSSMTLLPLIGLVIGLILFGIGYLIIGANEQVFAFIIILAYLWITGALHIDGFIDTVDGILSNRDRKRTLEIMKDSRIGAFGAIGLFMLLLGYFIAFQYSELYMILLMPLVGRSCAIIAAAFSEYAKKTNDLGKNYIESMGVKQALFGIVLSLIAIFILEYLYIIPFIICCLISYLSVFYFKKKLGGMTGDTMGMMIEFNQLLFVLIYILI